ncbi:MAG: shikimate dehydrogenase [Firmicutes bacterium]|nr:shikimate dehydrogenase [[Eubacterium] siraeum]MCM1488647.1 shikimate dehydrogenase [Bacillota bacterium]
MNKFALIGYPLGHSLSPQIHARLFELAGIEADYSLTEIKPEELKNEYGHLSELSGFNVTIPHKIAIIDFCDRLSEGAERYGSVNCVKIDGGKRIGYNTDVLGFVKSVEKLGASLSSKVCLLGCGGVGRMMAIEAAFQGAELTMAVRKEDIPVAEGIKGEIEKLLPQRKVKVIGLWEMCGGYDLVVNATPVGMYPKNEFSPLEKNQLKDVKYLFDAIYNPVETALVKKAREMGATASNGMDMLVLQAVAAHEIWDGSEYKNEDIKELISDMEKLV